MTFLGLKLYLLRSYKALNLTLKIVQEPCVSGKSKQWQLVKHTPAIVDQDHPIICCFFNFWKNRKEKNKLTSFRLPPKAPKCNEQARAD